MVLIVIKLQVHQAKLIVRLHHFLHESMEKCYSDTEKPHSCNEFSPHKQVELHRFEIQTRPIKMQVSKVKIG